MPIYDKPTHALMHDFAKAELKPGEIFSKSRAVDWFGRHYPLIKHNTVGLHVDGMAVNSGSRIHHSSIRPGGGFDLFYKVGRGEYRLWDPESDPAPIYASEARSGRRQRVDVVDEDDVEDEADGEALSSEFGAEADLQRYLAKNMFALEPGLTLFDDDGISGVEYPVGGRRIDLLGKGADGALVVVELKVSRGYDRVIGQILRYIGWVKQNLADGAPVRGIIVAREISQDLILAASEINGVRLVEYELAFTLKSVET